MRKFTLLVAGVALAAGTLSACIGGGGPPPPPPPPPTDPHDVLVVGDSVSFSFGCALGDAIAGVPAGGCPTRPGYSTHNESSGACTITPGTLKLYNGGTAGAPNCDTAPDDQGRTWEQAASFFTPKVVVINTAGWEVVDRWIESLTPQPDAQWGGPTGSGTRYERAAIWYSSRLFNAINMFRSKGAKVLVSIAPYFDPPEPVPSPSEVGQAFACSWWEPFDASPPSAPPGSGCPGAWRPPPDSAPVSYRSSKAKTDQFNAIINQTLTNYFGGDVSAGNVKAFRFDKHFNGPSNTYTSWVCPPPYDTTVAPVPNPPPANVTPQCAIPNPPSMVNAILARAPDNGHLSVAGTFNILGPYLESCVKALIPVAGGDLSKCS